MPSSFKQAVSAVVAMFDVCYNSKTGSFDSRSIAANTNDINALSDLAEMFPGLSFELKSTNVSRFGLSPEGMLAALRDAVA